MRVIDLYWITVGDSQHYYTSSQTNIKHDGHTWISQGIDHTGAIEQTSDPLKMSTSFDVAAGSAIASIALNPPLNTPVKLRILRLEGDDPVKTIFTGRIISGNYESGWVSVELEPLYSELNTNGLCESVTRQCRYALGSRKCGVALDVNKATVQASSGTIITLGRALPLDYQYGSLEYQGEAHAIDAQPNDVTIALLHGTVIPPGAEVRLIKGCDGTMSCCKTRFNNALNFGGAEHIPTTNPYTGDPINR